MADRLVMVGVGEGGGVYVIGGGGEGGVVGGGVVLVLVVWVIESGDVGGGGVMDLGGLCVVLVGREGSKGIGVGVRGGGVEKVCLMLIEGGGWGLVGR